MTQDEIAWNLTEIFKGPEDPEIDERLKDLEKRSEEIIMQYKGKINCSEFTTSNLLELIQIQEKFAADLAELNQFARLSFSGNMTKLEYKRLQNKAEEFSTKIRKKLAFLELDINKYVYENDNVIDNPILANYKHSLEKIKRAHPHILSEIEEQLILEKDQHGIVAWQKLQAKWLNTRKFDVEVEGELKSLTYGETNGLLGHSDRATRTSANKVIYGLLGKDQEIFSSAMESICGDWVKTSERRKYDSPMHQSLIANDVNQQTIDNLMKAIEDHVEIYRRYLWNVKN